MAKINFLEEEEDELQSPKFKTSDPATEKFFKSLPSNGPWRIMVTRLPKSLTSEKLKTALTEEFNITSTKKIEYSPGSSFCYIHFNSKTDCLQMTGLFGKSLEGSAIQIKANNSEQQQELRRLNTQSASGSKNVSKFSNLKQSRSRGQRVREQKHSHPVGGSIRKHNKGRGNQGRSNRPQNFKPQQKQNPWGKSNNSNTQHNQPQIMSRNNKPIQRAQQPARQAPNRFSQDNVRRRQDEGPRNTSNRRDFGNFRDREDNFRGGKKQSSSNDAETSMNWRRGGTRAAAPRRNNQTQKKTDDYGNKSNISKREEDSAPKRRANAFALLQDDED